ncbi:uncharacterized protein [Bos taurus]|uniref:uncharacterized protein isoform X3 n=1 Tax=Bos taurus TaxID=9913 RepID=UPI0028CBB85A|nr:uncharacterized protein LOC112447762 isoform X3 [Bos taurus]
MLSFPSDCDTEALHPVNRALRFRRTLRQGCDPQPAPSTHRSQTRGHITVQHEHLACSVRLPDTGPPGTAQRQAFSHESRLFETLSDTLKKVAWGPAILASLVYTHGNGHTRGHTAAQASPEPPADPIVSTLQKRKWRHKDTLKELSRLHTWKVMQTQIEPRRLARDHDPGLSH